jgi:Domain of unknown function (DUF222)
MSELDFSSLPDERLEAELVQLAADIAAGTARWFRLIAEYDRREVWKSWECRSMAAWLAAHVGVSVVTARQYVQVARTFVEFPLLAAEFDAGRLSYSRVRAVCRVVTSSSEESLVGLALNATAPQLERFVRNVERATQQSKPDDDQRQHERRELALICDDDGTWVIRGRLPAEVGAALRRALDFEIKRDADRRTAEEPNGSAMPRQLGLCCDSLLQHQVDALERLVTAGHAELEQNDSAASPRPLIVVHRFADGDELESGPVLSSAHADRLSLDADGVLEATHHRAVACGAPASTAEPGEIVDERVTYRKVRNRVAGRSQRRALMNRDQGCRFSGCSHKGSLHAHHVKEFHDGGYTITINMILLCSMHHHAVHRNGWKITGNPYGHLDFVRPGLVQPKFETGDLEKVIDYVTGPIGPAMRGESFDINLAVQAFIHNELLAQSGF